MGVALLSQQFVPSNEEVFILFIDISEISYSHFLQFPLQVPDIVIALLSVTRGAYFLENISGVEVLMFVLYNFFYKFASNAGEDVSGPVFVTVREEVLFVVDVEVVVAVQLFVFVGLFEVNGQQVDRKLILLYLDLGLNKAGHTSWTCSMCKMNNK